MPTFATCVQRHGGLVATHELHAAGFGRSAIRAAVLSRQLQRVRQGWYALPDERPELIAAARVGGRGTCQTAARARGLWVPSLVDGKLHVSVAPDRTQLRSPVSSRRRLAPSDEVRVHWADPVTPKGAGRRLLVPVERMIRDLIACADTEDAFVMIESARHLRILNDALWARIARDIPRHSPLNQVGPFSESGTESMFRFRMLPSGYRIRQQVRLERDRVDFVLGERLVIEIDSRSHHDAVHDRHRDARLGILGFRVLRFGYDMIVGAWPLVEAAVGAAVARGDHRA